MKFVFYLFPYSSLISWIKASNASAICAAGGITGGAISASMGGSFWSGFKAGALSSAVGWGVSKLAENYLDPQMQKKRADAQAKAEEILGVDKNEKANQLKSWNDVDNMVEATGHDGYDVQQQLKQLWVDTYGEDPGLISGNNFDFTSGGVLKVGELGNTLKFDNLHIRLEAGGGINYHYDYFNIMKTPLVHIMFDTIWQGVKFGKW